MMSLQIDDDDDYQQVDVLQLKVFEGIPHGLNYFLSRKRLALCPGREYYHHCSDSDDYDFTSQPSVAGL